MIINSGKISSKKERFSPLERTIQELIKSKAKTPADLATIGRKTAKKFKISCPSNVKLLKAYHDLLENKRIKKNKKLEELLIKRRVRSLSGVVIVSVLTKSYPCPGKCIYCPTEAGIPKSYLSGEPAVERAKKLNYNPYIQVQKRIESLDIQGHPIDKIELRIIGGSWSYYPKNYQIWFVKRCFQAANDFALVQKTKCQNIEKEQKRNEKAKCRIVGVSIETRPDLINKKEIFNLRKLGVTMVELGVQTIFDDILEKCQRGHFVKETISATKILKNAGFKIMYQMMPNLPGSDLKKDLKCFKVIFADQNFKPDWLKIYPCLVCKGSKLYGIWKKGKFKPYSDKELIELLIKIKKNLPYWVRLARLFRDIPAPKIEAGCKISNMREVVQAEMKGKGLKCKCIRCREVKEQYNPKEKIYLFRKNYNASDGKEIFLSYENKDRTKLFSFLRLRIPSSAFREMAENCSLPFLPVLRKAAIVRELHTYGPMLALGEKKLAPQHQGLGKKLINEAEKISKKEFNIKKIAVISGIGVRNYYKKLGYKLRETYMVKNLTSAS